MESHSLDLYVTRSLHAGIHVPHPSGAGGSWLEIAALEDTPACFSVHVKGLSPEALCVKGYACVI